jgi:hypothetical protein
MGIRSALARLVGGKHLTEVIEETTRTAVAEAIAGLELDPDDHLYRRDGGSTPRRDLQDLTHEKAIEVCYELYTKNPLGHRITELNRDFVVGEGITYTCRNPNVEDVVGEFWTDDDNDLDERLPDFIRDHGLFGELALELFPGDVSGFVKLGFIDPAQIVKVTTVEGNPLHLDVMFVRRKGARVKGQPLDIVRRRNGRLEGDVFFSKLNSPSNSTRGWPDLLHLADWLDNYDEFLWNVLERSRLIRNFIWDVLLKGKTPQEIIEWVRRHGEPPEAGSVRAHNENEIWSAVAPTMQSFEMAKEGEVILEHIAGGAGIQKTWLASAEDVNRATAREMGTPSERRLATRQRTIVRRIHRLLKFVLEEAEEAGRIKGEEELNGKALVPVYGEDGKATGVLKRPFELVQLHAPEISPRDAASSGTLILNLSQALATAELGGWFGHTTIRQVMAKALSRLGVDLDPATMADDPIVVKEPRPTEPARAARPIAPAEAETETPAPEVTVNIESHHDAPEIHVDMPPLTVEQPPAEPPQVTVNVPKPPPAQVTVHVPKPARTSKRVERDKAGNISRIVEEE